MRRLALFIIAVAALTSTVQAQNFEGNWSCRAPDGTLAGLLTIYGGSYGYASPVRADPASGTGSLVGYTDGVRFTDGNLRTALGVEAGRLVTLDTGGIAIQLETSSAVLMLCIPR